MYPSFFVMYRQKSSSPTTFAKRLSGSYQATTIATSLVSPLLRPDDQLGFLKQSSSDSAIQTVEQLGNCIRASVRRSDVAEETLKSAKAFTQVDQYLKNTQTSLDKMEQTLEKLLQVNDGIAKELCALDDIQASLTINNMEG